MILFSVGLLSPFADWCDAAVAQLAMSLGPAELLGANRVEEFTRAVIGAGSPYLVVGSRMMGRLQQTLSETNRPFLLALDDPRRSVQHLVEDQGVEFAEAVRLAAWSCASAIACAGTGRALVLHGADAEQDPGGTIAAIADHFGIPIAKADARGLAERLLSNGTQLRASAHQAWRESLDRTQQAILAGAVDPYAPRFRGGELETITWERELFYVDGGSDKRVPASRPVDVTGVPRFLIFGPYISLPPGSWSATVALGFSKEAQEIAYVIDFVAGGATLTSVRVQPGGRRSVEIDLHFEIDAPLEEPIVLRIANERAAFDGRLALGNVTLSQHAHVRSEVQDYFDVVLSE
jgi:hypothetical protein